MEKNGPEYSLTKRISNVKYGDGGKMFGVLNVNVKDCEKRVPQSHHFILTVDRSGSMGSRERDGMTKMQHVIHTISNMMRYFAYDLKDTEVFVSVVTFDDEVDCIIDKTRVNKQSINKLVQTVEEVYPRNMTDIGAAIAAANKQKTTFKDDANHTHILLTDGIPTCGATEKDELKDMLDSSYRNILIGYGIDHNMGLMKELGNNDSGNYYFVESAENAGNVYGEILHGVLNGAMSSTTLDTDTIEIYDWKKNKWVTSLEIGLLTYGMEKVYHIRTAPDQHDIENVLCVTVLYTSDGIERKELVPTITKEFDTSFDITKYIYRQKTLELLFSTANNMLVPDRLKDDITDLMNLISGEMDTEEELKDRTCKNYFFMQNLRDDLYVAKKSLSSRYGKLYLGARMLSQGDQRAYNVKNLDAMERAVSGLSVDWQDMDGPLPALGAIDRTCPAGNYKMSSAEASPYACTNQQFLMRQCSQDPSDTTNDN